MIRHSIVPGNLKGRYVGCRTDEGLCAEGTRLLKTYGYPPVGRIYASPMKRCIQTAEQIWPQLADQIKVVPNLRECDFGEFENKNYQELSDDPRYQAWVDSGGTLPFPGGESPEDFKRRCQQAFAAIAEEVRRIEAKSRVQGSEEGSRCPRMESAAQSPYRAALVVHGGTIMSIMERYSAPKKNYFDYQVKNGCGYVLTPAEGTELWNYRPWPQCSASFSI